MVSARKQTGPRLHPSSVRARSQNYKLVGWREIKRAIKIAPAAAE
jgi:hypothetical protein